MSVFQYVIGFLIVAAVAHSEISVLSKYKNLFEKLDIDALLKNNHFVSLYVNCLLDKHVCNKDGLLIRDVIPEIMETTCCNCTEKEKEVVRKAMSHIYMNRNADFENIYQQFDPQSIHRVKMMNFMFNNSTVVDDFKATDNKLAS